MHRKSIEAAEKLGHSDDEMEGCDSKDGMSECSSRSGHEMNKQQHQQRVPSANNIVMSKQQQNASSPADTQSPKSSGKGTPGPHRPTPPTSSPLNERPSPDKQCNTSSNNNPVTTVGGVVIRDDLRTSSIAALRARAMEHNAKMLHSLPGPPGSIMPPNHPTGGMGDPTSSAALLYHLDRQNASSIPTSMPYPFHSAPVRPIY